MERGEFREGKGGVEVRLLANLGCVACAFCRIGNDGLQGKRRRGGLYSHGLHWSYR